MRVVGGGCGAGCVVLACVALVGVRCGTLGVVCPRLWRGMGRLAVWVAVAMSGRRVVSVSRVGQVVAVSPVNQMLAAQWLGW